jgi:hypothetical protein
MESARWKARALVSALAVAFVIQLGYITIADEPYPAIMMPRFTWAGPTQSMGVDIMVPEIVVTYDDGTKKTFTQAQLFPNVNSGRVPTIVGNLLSPLPAVPATRRAPPNKYEPPVWLFPGYGLARVSRERPEHVASLRAWLRARASQHYAGASPANCRVSWYDDSYAYDPRVDPTQSRRGRTLTGTFEIDLHDAGAAAKL